MNLDDATIASFQKEMGAMDYKYQFIISGGEASTLALEGSTEDEQFLELRQGETNTLQPDPRPGGCPCVGLALRLLRWISGHQGRGFFVSPITRRPG